MKKLWRKQKFFESNFSLRNYPFMNKGVEVGSIDVGRPKSIISNIEDEKFLITINSIFGIASILTLIIAFHSSKSISKKFLNPIYVIKENAKKIELGKYKKIHEVETNTFELHELSVSINQLADKLNYQESLKRRMTTDIAHELRTPLSAIQSHIEAFMDGVWKPTDERLAVIHGEILRLTHLIKELSDLSIVEDDEIKLKVSNVDLTITLNYIIDSYELMFKEKNIKLNKNIQDNIMLLKPLEIVQN